MIEKKQFQTLLEQVRELHRLADELKGSATIGEDVRARLYWQPPRRGLPPGGEEDRG